LETRKLTIGVLFLLFPFLFSSCRLFYPNLLFKTDKFYQFTPPDTTVNTSEYVLKAGDIIEVQILSNNGYQLVDVIGQALYYSPVIYSIRNEGFSILPLLDSVYLAGYTISGAENLLSQRYSFYFVNPYVKIRVTNRRCTVFSGQGAGTPVQLDNENMSLLEVLGLAGGVPDSKTYKIKLIRGDLRNPQVYLIDLSTIEGMRKANLTVEANDVIYLEPAMSFSDINNQILPFISLFTTAALVITTIRGFKQ